MFWFTYRVARTTARALTPRRRYYRRSYRSHTPNNSGGSGDIGSLFGFAIVIWLLLTVVGSMSHVEAPAERSAVFVLVILGIFVAGRAGAQKSGAAPTAGFHGEPGHTCSNCPDPNRPVGPQTLPARKPPPDDAIELLPVLKPRQKTDPAYPWRPYQQPLIPDDYNNG